MTSLFNHNNKIVSTLLVVGLLLCLPSSQIFAQGDTAITLSALLLSVENHPELEMKRFEIEAAQSRVTMKSSLMDPMLILGVQNLPTNFSFNQDPMTGKVIGIGQSFPFPGKLGKERSIASLSVEMNQADLDEKRNILRKDVKISFFDILHRERSLTAYSHHLYALNDIEKEISTSAAFGKTPLSEIKKVELDRTEIRQMIAEEHSMIAMQMARLIYNTGLEIKEIHSPDSLTLPAFGYSADSLLAIAILKRPLLRGIRSGEQQAEEAIRRAELDRYPDFDVMLMYMQRDALAPTSTMSSSVPQMNMVSAQLQIKLPVNYNGMKDAQVAEMRSMKRMKLSEEEMTKREIRMMLAEKLAKLDELRTKHELLKSQALPSLRSIRQSFVTDYQYDKSTLQSVAGSELALLHKTHDSFEIESEYYKTIAEIEFIVGTDLIPIIQ